jgi:hypothetical protein
MGDRHADVFHFTGLEINGNHFPETNFNKQVHVFERHMNKLK